MTDLLHLKSLLYQEHNEYPLDLLELGGHTDVLDVIDGDIVERGEGVEKEVVTETKGIESVAEESRG